MKVEIEGREEPIVREFEPGMTLAQIADQLELDQVGLKARVNNRDQELTFAPPTGASVYFVPYSIEVVATLPPPTNGQPKVSQGNISVTAGRLPGKSTTIMVASGTTAGTILEKLELDANGFELRLNGQFCTLDTAVTEDGSVVHLVRAIQGN